MLNVGIFLSIIATIAAIILSIFAFWLHQQTKTEKLLNQFRKTRTYALTIQTFGSKENGEAWLKKPHQALNGRPPLVVAQTESGREEVEKVLIAINFGNNF
ncbi:MAG: hypothetical protein CTY38_04785 [Methylotenera sp.]|uniref:MbcA/ParS/Xre antitoxin family protein n=1 Tax=Methylotenera sp. TaxID=2051956 RepID=UPI000D4A96DC|nr:MbcA/ParS/Xre antitoxin family protein [Methylotenera sp.]PPC83153.1 MAG: hypothetical protein CTY38_04785 [Methylotenera sp.]